MTLQDKVNKNKHRIKLGGQLTEITGEELQQLSKKTGRIAPPTSPMGVIQLGGTDSQAKMAGSDQQKKKAIRQSIDEAYSYGTQTRQAQPRTEQTTEEAEWIDRLTTLEQLGNLQQAVPDAVQQWLGSGTLPDEYQLTVSDDAVRELTADLALDNETKQTVTSLLGKLADGSITNEGLVKLGESLGYTSNDFVGESRDVIVQEIRNTYLTTTESITEAAGDEFGTQIKLGNLTEDQFKDLGIDNIEQMNEILGINSDEFGELTLGELTDKIETIRRDEFTRVQELQQRATDPFLGAAERAEARRQLKQLGASGVRAAEADFADLTEQVQSMETVEFQGKSYTVEELLQSDTIAGIVKRYLTEPDSDWARELEDNNPGFTKWITEHRAGLETATEGIEGDITEFGDIQEEVQNLNKLGDGIELDDDTMDLIIPGYSEMGLSAEVPEQPAILQLLKDEGYNIEQRNEMARALNGDESYAGLAELTPHLVEELATLSLDQIKALGLNTADGLNSLRDLMVQIDTIESMDPDSHGTNILNAVFGHGVFRSEDDLNKYYNNAQAFDAAGLVDIDDDLYNLIDPNKDGSTSVREVYDTYIDSVDMPKTLAEMLEQGRSVNELGYDAYDKLPKSSDAKLPNYLSTRDVVKYWGDGKLDAKEGKQLIDKLNNAKQAESMLSDIESGKLDNVDDNIAGNLNVNLYSRAMAWLPDDLNKFKNYKLKSDMSADELAKRLNEYKANTRPNWRQSRYTKLIIDNMSKAIDNKRSYDRYNKHLNAASAKLDGLVGYRSLMNENPKWDDIKPRTDKEIAKLKEHVRKLNKGITTFENRINNSLTNIRIQLGPKHGGHSRRTTTSSRGFTTR